nr:capsular polysaccharide synthesis protein [Pseudohalocynthiibacter sp. F2068]
MKGYIVPSHKPWVWFFASVVRIKQFRSIGRRIKRKLTHKSPDGFEISAPRLIPKTVWIFWDSGEERAPDLVKMCIASWREQNPEWTIHVLDKDSVSQFTTLPDLSPEISVQAFADLLRCRLLKEHGGVWADATTFCVRPLNHWLPIVAQQGFFAFTWTKADQWFLWPGYKRELTNWFLASERDGAIISVWEEYCFDYWEGRLHPHLYFWPHTLFETLLYMLPSFRKTYESVPKIGCLGPHIVHDCIVSNRDVEKVSLIIADGAVPVQKLRWQWNEEQIAMAKSLLLGSEKASVQPLSTAAENS